MNVEMRNTCNKNILSFQSGSSHSQIITDIVSKTCQDVIHPHISKKPKFCLWHCEKSLLSGNYDRRE